MFGEDQRNPGELGFELGAAWAAGCLGGAFLGVQRAKDLAGGGEANMKRRRARCRP